jgi:hypothetical protein
MHINDGGEVMTTTPRWYKTITIIALLWNLLGCLAVVSDLTIKPENVARLSPNEQALYAARTAWSAAASALAVFGGAAGCLGLILRKRWAMSFLLASLVGLVVQDYGLVVVAKGLALVGPSAIIIQGAVLLIAIGLVMLARSADKHGWIPQKPSTGSTVDAS